MPQGWDQLPPCLWLIRRGEDAKTKSRVVAQKRAQCPLYLCEPGLFQIPPHPPGLGLNVTSSGKSFQPLPTKLQPLCTRTPLTPTHPPPSMFLVHGGRGGRGYVLLCEPNRGFYPNGVFSLDKGRHVKQLHQLMCSLSTTYNEERETDSERMPCIWDETWQEKGRGGREGFPERVVRGLAVLPHTCHPPLSRLSPGERPAPHPWVAVQGLI